MAHAELRVRLRPAGSANRIEGFRDDGTLLVRVAAPAQDGRANAALEKVLAKRLRVARGAVTIVRGQRSRDKVVRIEGLDEQAVRSALDK